MTNKNTETKELRSASINRTDSELDLFSLLLSLWERRILIVSVFLAVLSMAGVYIGITEPVYQVHAELKRPGEERLKRLVIPGVFSISPGRALTRVGNSLMTYDVRLAFFNEHPELFGFNPSGDLSAEQFYAEFDAAHFQIARQHDNDGLDLSVHVNLQYNKGIEADRIVEQLILWVQAREVESLKSDISLLIEQRLVDLDMELSNLRRKHEKSLSMQVAQLLEQDNIKKQQFLDEKEAIKSSLIRKRKNRIKQLEEAIRIAKSLGIKRPVERASASYVGVPSPDYPLYLLGSEALEAEKAVLISREDDSFVEPELIRIDRELALLGNNRYVETMQSRGEESTLFINGYWQVELAINSLKKFDVEVINPVLLSIDRGIIASVNPVKPRRTVILGLAGIVGLMLGLLSALAAIFIGVVKNEKKRLPEADSV